MFESLKLRSYTRRLLSDFGFKLFVFQKLPQNHSLFQLITFYLLGNEEISYMEMSPEGKPHDWQLQLPHVAFLKCSMRIQYPFSRLNSP
jgi:hypothetical protein